MVKVLEPTPREVATANVKRWEAGFDDGYAGVPRQATDEFYRVGHRAGARVHSREDVEVSAPRPRRRSGS